MHRHVPKPVVQSIVQFTAMLLENQTAGDEMEELSLKQLSMFGEDEPTEDETRLIGTLAGSDMTQLEQLTINVCPTWFANEDQAAEIVEFISA